MDAITSEILRIGISESAKFIFQKVLSRNWIDEYKRGRNIVEQLLSIDIQSDYIVKHISRAMKMRTIHSSENDIMLNSIYHPLTINRGGENFKVGDNFILSDENITNIIGFAGQGKSTILRKILLESIKNGEKIPFFLEFRKIEKNGIENSLLSIIEDLGIKTNKESLISLLKSGNILLLLDGFDEVSSKMRFDILNEILHLNRRYGLQIITTSRDGTEICAESSIVNYTVNKIKRSDITSILKKLSESQEVEEDTLKQIFNMLKGNTSLVETMNSPLLVTLFYICYPHLDSIPNSATEFYSKLFTTLYFRHDKIKNYKRERKSNTASPEAFNVFCALCFKSIYDNKQDFTELSLFDYAKQSLKICGINDPNPEYIANDFVDITCLIQKDGYDRYVFLHKSIQEYHAAEYVKSLSLEKKKKFMSTIMISIQNESKLSATARYLYEIDKENTYDLICKPLCEKYGIDKYKDDESLYVENLYSELLDGVCFRLFDKPKKSKNKKEHSEMIFEKGISSIGPFNNSISPLFIFSRHYNGEQTNLYTNLLIKEAIRKEYLEALPEMDAMTYNTEPSNNNATTEKYYIKLSDVIEKLNEKEYIKEKIMAITSTIYHDVFSSNRELMERKDNALNDIFGI
ncbi:NACHT domain-containing protein [Morganella morganii]